MTQTTSFEIVMSNVFISQFYEDLLLEPELKDFKEGEEHYSSYLARVIEHLTLKESQMDWYQKITFDDLKKYLPKISEEEGNNLY